MSDFIHGSPTIDAGISDKMQVYVEAAASEYVLGANVGESVYARDSYTSSTAAASGEMVLAGFVAKKTQQITQVRVWTSGTAAAATPTLSRMGIYVRSASTGDLTLLASHASDLALFLATNTVYTKTLTTAFNKTQGLEYFVGLLIVSGAAMPTFAAPASGWPAGYLASTGSLVRPATMAKVTAQADLPATVLNASVVAAAFTFHCYLLA